MDPLCVLPTAGPIGMVWHCLAPEDLARAARVCRGWHGALLADCRRRVTALDCRGVFYVYRLLLRSSHAANGRSAGLSAEAEAARICRVTLRLRRRPTVPFETWLHELSTRACARCLVGKENVRLCGESPPLPLCRPCRTRGTHSLSLVSSTEVYDGAARAFAATAPAALARSEPARRSLMRHVRKTLAPVRLTEQLHHYFRPQLLRVAADWWRWTGENRWGTA